MYMVHGDDNGLVLPPKVAPVQAIVITIPNSKLSAEDLAKMNGTFFNFFARRFSRNDSLTCGLFFCVNLIAL